MYTKPVDCTSVYITRSLYKCTQNQLTVQVYTKPVDCASVHKTRLLCKCTQNIFTVQVYTKPVYCTSTHKTSWQYKCTQNQFTVQVYTSLLVNNERNVHGQNIKECTHGFAAAGRAQPIFCEKSMTTTNPKLNVFQSSFLLFQWTMIRHDKKWKETIISLG